MAVGVEDSPVLQVGDDTLDDCTDAVDGAVEGFCQSRSSPTLIFFTGVIMSWPT
jgi:hypothetical protein